jgi:hypothetical protein
MPSYLNRLAVETMRARFCYAADCRLVADQMSKDRAGPLILPLRAVLCRRAQGEIE